MKTDQNRVSHLIEYVTGIMNKEDGKALYDRFKNDIEGVTPQEVFEIFYHMLTQKTAPKDILVFLDKIINVFYKSLSAYSWKRPEQDSFAGYLLKENSALVKKLEDIKGILKEPDFEKRKRELLQKVQELTAFKQHYLKKENILFPYLERKLEKFNGLAIMWALHDETRLILKHVIEVLERNDCKEEELNIVLGSLFFAMYGLVKKEELILFPAASEIITPEEWQEMQYQSLEYEFPFIERPQAEDGEKKTIAEYKEGYLLKTDTGELQLEQLLMIFNALPVDLTFVDENNKVRFFTRPKDRIFPRSAAVIGRDVEKCHPPQSVHIVNEIVDSFRRGEQDQASFWINLKGKMILIQYFALRNDQGVYKGVLEVSQDITEINGLEGERKLLHWKK